MFDSKGVCCGKGFLLLIHGSDGGPSYNTYVNCDFIRLLAVEFMESPDIEGFDVCKYVETVRISPCGSLQGVIAGAKKRS